MLGVLRLVEKQNRMAVIELVRQGMHLPLAHMVILALPAVIREVEKERRNG